MPEASTQTDFDVNKTTYPPYWVGLNPYRDVGVQQSEFGFEINTSAPLAPSFKKLFDKTHYSNKLFIS